jgi:hypothetical protein
MTMEVRSLVMFLNFFRHVLRSLKSQIPIYSQDEKYNSISGVPDKVKGLVTGNYMY